MEQKTVNQPVAGHTDHAHFQTKRQFNPLAALMMKRKLMAMGQRRTGGAGAYSMPRAATSAKPGHHLAHWRMHGRQALVTRALALGVLVKGKTPDIIGKPGRGQFRTWKALAAAVERAERTGVQVDEVAAK